MLYAVCRRLTDNQDTANVEEEDTVKRLLDGGGHSLARVLGLTDGDTNKLGAHVGEKSKHEGVDKAAELAEVAADLVRLECTAVHPVRETETLLPGHTAEVDDETQEDEAGERDDFHERQPKLDLAKPLDAETIDGNDEDDKDRDPGGRVDARVPKLDDEGGSDDLVGR
jgi:hypothetical protein